VSTRLRCRRCSERRAALHGCAGQDKPLLSKPSREPGRRHLGDPNEADPERIFKAILPGLDHDIGDTGISIATNHKAPAKKVGPVVTVPGSAEHWAEAR
jgi:hypothetical protein